MDDLKIPSTFEVEIYGDLKPFPLNPLHSLARVRIFYKYKNRNRTFITDDFAKELLASLPYTTVGGIYNKDEEDFSVHGKANQGKIYGIVPENPNINWEDHTDKDGVIRQYACCDVILFTARYEEANLIMGKSQSMEIYPPSRKGAWEIIDGLPYFKFTAGKFFGLQVLGDEVIPCFEGASFYNLQNEINNIISEIKQYALSMEGGKTMDNETNDIVSTENVEKEPVTTFSTEEPTNENQETEIVSTEEPATNHAYVEQRHTEINAVSAYPSEEELAGITTEEGGEVVGISEHVTEINETVIRTDTKTGESRNEASSSVEQNIWIDVKNPDGTITTIHNEESSLQVIHNYELALQEQAASIESLQSEIKTFKTENYNLSQKIEGLTSENLLLNEYKKDSEKSKKKDLLDKYSKIIDTNTINLFINKIDEYSYDDLKKDLATEYVDSNSNKLFSEERSDSYMLTDPIINSATELTGTAKIIKKYQDKNKKK